MLHFGLGESDVNGVLATLNIRGITPRNLKKREREAGDAIETVATATCDKAIVDERASCDSNSKQKSVSTTETYVAKTTKKRRLTQQRHQQVDFKKRIYELKASSSTATTTKELREGPTYNPALSLEEDCDISVIPDPVSPPTCVPLLADHYTWAYFDLETTALGAKSQIVQIGAVCGGEPPNSFNCYVHPGKTKIDPRATSVHGLQVINNKMYHHQTEVASVSLLDGLVLFKEWFSKIGPKPVLVCHNGKAFDAIVMCRAVQQHLQSGLKDVISGFVDTLPLFKDVLPGQVTYKLESLLHSVLQTQYNAHCALEDVLALQKLVIHLNVPNSKMLTYSFSTNHMFVNLKYKSLTEKCMSTLHPLSNCITDYMMSKIASSGLSYDHLKLGFERGGKDGLSKLLKEKNNTSKARVTSDKKILKNLPLTSKSRV
ncbi:hypothetical protein KP79_PYT01251 [Mizuhopecten yessoensis]|uniref:Exonuclease domain-containing protein n=1 Tax=Mizuhopecten yessoensis TaxID=6573 RepID=A0A210QHC6_MIZYE|nr:hypothetical protein KP79_PYT01251 [Mizuhopecten yessoensis]